MEFIEQIKLNFVFPKISFIQIFKFLESQNCFQIICVNFTEVSFKPVVRYEFDLKGNLLLEQFISENNEENLLEIYDNNLIEPLYVNVNNCYKGIKIFKNYNLMPFLDLFEFIYNDDKDDWGYYEYFTDYATTNQPNQLSFIAGHANYGVQGVKIIEINSASELELIYDMDDLEFEGGFHNLTFNSLGEKFSLLLCNGYNNYLVCEYSVKDNQKPIKIYNTNFNYIEKTVIDTHYITNDILCLVRSRDFILLDLVNGTTKNVIERDLKSEYLITFNLIVYYQNNKLISIQY